MHLTEIATPSSTDLPHAERQIGRIDILTGVEREIRDAQEGSRLSHCRCLRSRARCLGPDLPSGGFPGQCDVTGVCSMCNVMAFLCDDTAPRIQVGACCGLLPLAFSCNLALAGRARVRDGLRENVPPQPYQHRGISKILHRPGRNGKPDRGHQCEDSIEDDGGTSAPAAA